MLDTLTLLIVLIVSNLLMAGALWITFAGRFKSGLGQWTASLIVQGVCWMLIATSNDIADYLSIAVATAFLVYCWALQMSAILEFHGRPTPRWLLYGPAVIAFLIVGIYVHEPKARLAVCGLGLGIAQLATAVGMVYYRVAAELRTRLLLAASFLLMAGGLFWLAFTAWFEPEAIMPTVGSTPAPGVSLIIFYGVTIASSFAFLLMHKERADRESHELATIDSLTGVYNRRTFKELADPQFSRARRVRSPISLLLLDIDHFKRINDTYGHLAGDQALTQFARLVRTCLRKEDLLARFGGEEFVVLLPGAADAQAAASAERIREEVCATPLRVGEHDIKLTVSIGLVTESGEQLPLLEAMVGAADEALYAAKAAGRNRVMKRAVPRAVATA
jgi:diguanylate cyclase (GGDEF)-like protein